MKACSFWSFSAAAALLLLAAGPSFAQSKACGPTLGYESAEGDHVTLVGATCAFFDLLGPVALRPHIAYGFGHYDWGGDFGVSGDYSAIRAGAVAFYPFQVSDTSPIVVYPLIGAGVLSWWEDCDGDGCSDTEIFIDLGAGASYNQFGLEIFIIAGDSDVSMDFGARLHALFNI